MFEDNLDERYGLAFERIKQINSDCDILQDGFCEYFKRVSDFIIEMDKLKHNIDTKYYENAALEELQRVNTDLYKDVLDSTDAYDKSFANPSYACERLGLDYGRLLSFLYIEIRGMIVYAYEKRTAQMTAVAELFVEIYCMFEQADSLPEYQSVLDCVYWYVSDYSDDMIEYRISEMLNPDYSFATDIIMNSDLNDLRYLYRFGEYITDNEIKTARYLNSLSQSEIESMAATFTEGYRIGFELGNKDISKKKTVNIRYCIGFERLVREEIKQFEKIGLKSTIYRAAADSINKKMHIKIGYVSTSPNKQMDYDHRFDNALYLDSQFVERKLGALKLAYEKNKTYAAEFGGPAVMEIFGEVPFEPVDKPESLRLDEKQQKLSVKYNNEASAIVNTYIKGEERSFTIIAYPIPEIGDNYEQIFNETVKINTLDYDKYKVIQQNIIEALDGADYVSVKGCNGNTTDMRVSIMPIADKT